MPGYSLRPPLLRIFFLALTLMAPRFVAAQASGPQSVRVPPPATKAGAAKTKTDRSNLPQIPNFKDIAKDVGLTAVHIAAPEARTLEIRSVLVDFRPDCDRWPPP